jgi:hypothetical protein
MSEDNILIFTTKKSKTVVDYSSIFRNKFLTLRVPRTGLISLIGDSIIYLTHSA